MDQKYKDFLEALFFEIDENIEEVKADLHVPEIGAICYVNALEWVKEIIEDVAEEYLEE